MTTAANLPLPPVARRSDPKIDPAVVQGIRQASRTTHVDFGYLMAQAAQESGFRSDAKATTSSATGLFQFIDATWLKMVQQHGAEHGLAGYAAQIATDGAGRPVVADPAVREKILALRKDPAISAALAAEYAKSNKEEVERAIGRPAGSADLYLAHFLGAGGASELLKAVESDGATPAATLLPEAAAANRSVFYDPQSGAPRSVAEIYRSFADRVERQAAGYAQLDGVTDGPLNGARGAAWSAFGGPLRSLGTPIASVFNAMMLTALRLLGSSDAITASAVPGLPEIAASAASRHRDDKPVS